MQETEAGTATK